MGYSYLGHRFNYISFNFFITLSSILRRPVSTLPYAFIPPTHKCTALVRLLHQDSSFFSSSWCFSSLFFSFHNESEVYNTLKFQHFYHFFSSLHLHKHSTLHHHRLFTVLVFLFFKLNVYSLSLRNLIINFCNQSWFHLRFKVITNSFRCKVWKIIYFLRRILKFNAKTKFLSLVYIYKYAECWWIDRLGTYKALVI